MEAFLFLGLVRQRLRNFSQPSAEITTASEPHQGPETVFLFRKSDQRIISRDA